MTYTPTPAEIEAAAESLARNFFFHPPHWSLSDFPTAAQDGFRDQARTDLEAAAVVSEEPMLHFRSIGDVPVSFFEARVKWCEKRGISPFDVVRGGTHVMWTTITEDDLRQDAANG